MARARNIKPGFFQNEDLAELPYSTRLLFIGLWTLADRDGYLEDRPKRIKMALFPGDDLNVDKALEELQQARFIRRYTAGDGRYIEVCQFQKHQNPHHREPPSTIPKPEASPGPDGGGTKAKPETVTASDPPKNLGKPEAGPGLALLIPDSGFLIPESRENPLRDLTIARDRKRAFEEWWQGYPRKVGKADAEKAWIKLKPDEAMQTVLTEAVAKQREWDSWRREGGRFIPHAATWLNGRRWLDEGDAGQGVSGYDYERIARMANLSDEAEAAGATD